jgi:putative ABC transport system permease protein
MPELLAHELAGPRFHVFALCLFAVVAVLLAGVGVFGVLGAFVAYRSRELGLRVALGARGTDLHRLVLFKVGWPAALGLSAGTCVAFATTPLLRPLLFQVSAIDARAFAAGWVMLALTTLLASLVPLRRASRVDPVTLLRSE